MKEDKNPDDSALCVHFLWTNLGDFKCTQKVIACDYARCLLNIQNEHFSYLAIDTAIQKRWKGKKALENIKREARRIANGWAWDDFMVGTDND